jgi:hypothetical protein
MDVTSITVSADRLEAVVRLAPNDPVRASDRPGLADAVCEALPGIRRHTCTSPESGLLLSELADTETAHLFEHAALEIMVLAGSPRTLSGRTDWDAARDGSGVYRISLEMDDDLVAVGAVRVAREVFEAALDGVPIPDVESRIAALRRLRRTP